MDPRLCSRHFSPEAFDAFSRPMLMKELTGGGNYKRRLKPNAVPTHKPTKLPRGTTEVRSRKRQRQDMLDYLLGGCKQTATADVASGGEQWDTITEEAVDESYIQSRQQSVSVQYSPKTNDVTTQTEKHTSDAAVLWPADAHQLITNDHVYAAANCENKLKKKRFVVCCQCYHFHLWLSRVQT